MYSPCGVTNVLNGWFSAVNIPFSLILRVGFTVFNASAREVSKNYSESYT
jgi:hypothetical protein